MEVVADREAGVVDLLRRRVGAANRVDREELHRRVHGAEHLRRGAVADHLERAHRLVQMHAGHAQRAGVGLGRLRALARKTAQRLADALECLLDLAGNPGQRPEVVGRGRRDGR